MHGDGFEQIQADDSRFLILSEFLYDGKREKRRVKMTLLDVTLPSAMSRVVAQVGELTAFLRRRRHLRW